MNKNLLVLMIIYSSEADFFLFKTPYGAKFLLDDSVTRTRNGFCSISEFAVLTGCSNILLGRIESVAAAALATLSSSILMLVSLFITPMFLIPTMALNLASRIPGVSSFEFVQNFTRDSSSAIYRIFRVYLIAIPVICLFVTTSTINTFLPGILSPKNILFNTMHRMVEPLGPLKTIRATVPGVRSVEGTETKPSILDGAEEYLRALSCENYLREVTVSSLTHHYSYSK